MICGLCQKVIHRGGVHRKGMHYHKKCYQNLIRGVWGKESKEWLKKHPG